MPNPSTPSIDALILGGSGYGGGELYRWLLQHPHVASIAGVAKRQAGNEVAVAHPHLRGLVSGKFQSEPDWAALAESECPVLFAALPHGELGRLYADYQQQWQHHELADRLLVIDLSGDFRLRDPAVFEKAYGGTHPCPQFLPDFEYGLVDWQPDRLRSAKRIANPGCFATALSLGLLWLAHLPAQLRPESVAISAITGSSGSGASASDTTHHPTRAHDFRAYKPLRHQHRFEVSAAIERAGWSAPFSLVTHSAPVVRGIYATLQFAAGECRADDMDAAFERAFAGARSIRRVPAAPRLVAVTGTNFTDINCSLADGYGAVMVALDNLGKGMAGQAVQNMNLATGLAADCGLRTAAAYPG